MNITRPWSKTIIFDKASLNSALDGGDIADHELKTASHVLFDKGVIEKGIGRTQLGTTLEGGAVIDGQWRSWNKDGDKQHICEVNGKIKRWTGSTWSDLSLPTLPNGASALNIGTRFDHLNHNDKTLIVNGLDPAIEFNPATNDLKLLGLEPLQWFKKVAYFETDETITQDTATASRDTTVYRSEERTGKSRASLKLYASAGAVTPQGHITYTSAQNFSIFDNNSAMSNDDLLILWIFHTTRVNVASLNVDFWTSTGNYYRATIDVSELDPILVRNNQWTKVKVRRSRFVATGSPSWANINRFYASMTSVTGATTVYVDNAHWVNAPIQATSYQKTIDNFEGVLSDWTASVGTLTNNFNYRFVKDQLKSLKWVHTASATIVKNLATTLDLTQYIDGITSQTSDQIALWVYTLSTVNLTSITIYAYNDTGETNGYSMAFTVAGGDFNQTKDGAWTDLRARKSAFSNVGTPTGWNSIVRYKISIVVSGSTTLYFDSFRLEENLLIKEIAGMERDSEVWTSTAPADSYGFANEENHHQKGTYSIFLKVPKKTTYSISRTLAAVLDLTIFATGEASGTDDIIAFWMAWTVFTTIKEIEIRMDVKSGGVPDYTTDYYSYKMTPQYLQELLNLTAAKTGELKDKSTQIEIKKSDFTKVGPGTTTWHDLCGVQFLVSTAEKGNQTTIYFDHLHMRRASGLTGIYEFCAVPFSSDNTMGAPSAWSNQVTLTGTKALLKNIPLSQDSDCMGRYIFRKGGSQGSNARLDTTIWDNTSTQLACSLIDSLLGRLLDEDDIPSGTIRVPMGAKWGPKFKGRGILYRDSSNLRRMYWSNSEYLYAWSEVQAYDFDSNLFDVFMKDDIIFVNCASGMKRIPFDLNNLSTTKPEEMGMVKPSISQWGSCKAETQRAYVTYDGVVLFSGMGSSLISEGNGNVINYFDPVNYDIDQAIAFYHKRHLYVSVMTNGGVRTLLDCYLPKIQWSTKDYIVNCFCVYDAPTDNGDVYIGDLTGNIYQLTGYTTTTIIETKAFDAGTGNPFDEILLKEIWLKVKSDSVNTGTLVVEFLIDQIMVATFYLDTPSSGDISNIYKTYFGQLQGVHNYLKGSKISVRLTHATPSKHFALEALHLSGEISGLPNMLEEDVSASAIVDLYLGNLASDPDTSGWGVLDEGKFWYNTTDNHWKGWNSMAIHVLG